jgi:hypothetical protein
MTHDPLCPYRTDDYDGLCKCDLIARVREDERRACISTIRSRRDTFVEMVAARPVQTRSLSSAIYEDAIATLRGKQ